MQPHDLFRELAPGLHVLDGEWYDSPLRRRMTVVRLPTGQLLIHNAIHLKSEDYRKLDALGEVNWILAPDAFHGSDAHHYERRYPPAKFYVSQGAAREVARSSEIDGIRNADPDRSRL